MRHIYHAAICAQSLHKTHNITHTHLEHMERFELDILAVVPQPVHDHLEIGFVPYVARHGVEVAPIEQNLAE